MTLGKTLLELANKGFDIRFVYHPIAPETLSLFSDEIAIIISKGEYYQKITVDVYAARQIDDANIDTLLESALENGAKKVMERLLEENDGSN